MRFRVLIGALVLLIGVYVVFWFVAVHDARVQLETWLRDQQAAGHSISYQSMDIGGFPYRIEVQLRELEVTGSDGVGNWSLTAPKAAVVAMPWARRHRILFAEELTLTLDKDNDNSTLFVSDSFRGSVVVNEDEEPLRLSLTAETLEQKEGANDPDPLVVRNAQLHWRTAAEATGKQAGEEDGQIQEPLSWQLALKGDDISRAAFKDSPYGQMIQHFEGVFEMRGKGIEGSLSRASLAHWRDNGGTVEVTDMAVRWGDLDATMTGSVTLDQQFRPLGAFAAEVQGIDPLINHFTQLGVMAPEEADAVRSTFDALIAADTKNDGRLSVPLTMQAGRLFLGPMPIAELPPIADPEL